jgi:hypothetical protein
VSNGVAFFFKQDSAYHDGQRPWLVEEDGRKMKWRQYPGELTMPVEVGLGEEGQSGQRERFRILETQP